MNINELQAGPELDAMVAERVMGWTWHQDTNHPEDQPSMVSPNKQDCWHRSGIGRLPRYSTDIAADYEVLEHVRKTWDRAIEANKPENSRMDDDGLCCHPTNYRRLHASFYFHLRRMWEKRSKAQDGGEWTEEIGQYLPGDYSRAALLAVGGGT